MANERGETLPVRFIYYPGCPVHWEPSHGLDVFRGTVVNATRTTRIRIKVDRQLFGLRWYPRKPFRITVASDHLRPLKTARS